MTLPPKLALKQKYKYESPVKLKPVWWNLNVYKLGDGAFYEGQTREGLPHGIGTLFLKDDIEYLGHWKVGKPHGFGELKHNGICKYKGEWCEGKMIVMYK